ncbi:MAG: CehA/McbA family metallohydrolase [Sandaracinaceae bacterium]
MPSRRALSTLSFFLVSLVACDDGVPLTDAGPPPPTECESVPAAPMPGDPNGHADPLGAPSGQSRAGRLTAALVPVDRTGLGTFAAGDFVIANDRFALLIEDAGASDLYDPYGGRPVGIAEVEGGALVNAGDFNELLFGLGLSLVETESVTVVADGSDGGPAIVRAAGQMAPLEFIGDLLSSVIGGTPLDGLPAAMDYTMAPGSDAIDISLTIVATEPTTYRVPLILAGSFQRYRMPIWTEQNGFSSAMMPVEYAAFIDDGATSYAYFAPDGGTIEPLIEETGVLIYGLGRTNVEACSELTIPLGRLVLGGPGQAGLQQSIARVRGGTLRTVSGTVTRAGSPVGGVRVHVRRADGSHFARLASAEDGTFEVDVPDEDVTMFAFLPGTGLVGPIAAPMGTGTADIAIPPVGKLLVTATDEANGEAIPVRVQVIPVTPLPAPDPDLGERDLGRGRAVVELAMTGMAEAELVPGEYDVIVSRGYEYELTRDRVTIAADTDTEVIAQLAHSVLTPTTLCADYHIHTNRSPDSPDPGDRKVMSLVADGLDVAVRSDHEWVNDFEPTIANLGVERWVLGIGGEELTTFSYGHFGVFPLVEDRAQRSGGAIDWVGRLPPPVFADVRARPEQPVLIINHPRKGGAIGGYFNAAGFDRETGSVAYPDYWDDAFTIVEVFNSSSLEGSRDTTVADWFSLLNHGRRVFAVGSSDSHRLDSDPPGYPRTCLAMGTDDPRMVTADDIRDVTAAGHSYVSGGIVLNVVGPGGAGPGDTVADASGGVLFDVDVYAPSWLMGTLELEVIVDGESSETIPITEADRDPSDPAHRLHATGVMASAASALSYVIFHVRSDGDLAPLQPGNQAFAVSNPIFLTP